MNLRSFVKSMAWTILAMACLCTVFTSCRKPAAVEPETEEPEKEPVRVVDAHTPMQFYAGDVTRASDHHPVYVDIEFL